MTKYYLHKIELATGRSVIALDNSPKPSTTYTYFSDAPIVDAEGKRVPNKTYWSLGPVQTKNEAQALALAIAERYGFDVMVNGGLAGLPYMGEPGKWVSNSEAAATLGKIKSKKKTLANRAKANLPPKPGSNPRGRPKTKKDTQS